LTPLPAGTVSAAIAAVATFAIAVPARSGPDMSALMRGVLGPYPMTRESSGTSWQPDASVHAGFHHMAGEWLLMGHALLDGVYDWQQGPRGDRKAFVSGMFMGAARRAYAGGDMVQLRAMLSPDPLMGRYGLPLLLQTGETADGITPLVDRQHPHDLFVELSASYSHPLGARDAVFVYAGLPGEPAFGPPAFLHRLSAMDSPEPPITHHWLDSTHIVFGVVTAGFVHERWKLEMSRFRGREPDQFRYNIETGRLDSTAVRISWNPASTLSLQLSWADLMRPEQLHPDENQRKWSASGLYTRPFHESGWWSTTLAWGRRSSESGWLDACAIESALRFNAPWTGFVRGERVANDELVPASGSHGPAFTVSKLSLGVVRDYPLAGHAQLGVGAQYAFDFVPRSLAPLYGSSPQGAMVFVRLRVE
jgi:hypothetical protein